MTFLFSQTLSPKTPCEAQLSVDFGSGKTLGLIQIQSRTARRGNIDHRPIQDLLQRAKVNKGRHVMILVHALHGLACRSQVVSDINNIFVITLFCVFMMIFPPKAPGNRLALKRSGKASPRSPGCYLVFRIIISATNPNSTFLNYPETTVERLFE